MTADQLPLMLQLAGAVFGLGVLALIPLWWRGRRVRRGEVLPIDETDVMWRNIAGSLLVFGTVSAVAVLLRMASLAMSFGMFMMLIAAWCGIGLAIAFGVDAARARRRHR